MTINNYKKCKKSLWDIHETETKKSQKDCEYPTKGQMISLTVS